MCDIDSNHNQSQSSDIRCSKVISLMVFDNDKCVCSFDIVLKTSRTVVHQLAQFSGIENCICPLTCLRHYIEQKKVLRGSTDQVFTSFQWPHQPVSSQTLSIWLVTTLTNFDINRNFSAHITRTAAASKAAPSLNSNSILKAVGWLNEYMVAKFCNKTIVDTSNEFSRSMLRHCFVSYFVFVFVFWTTWWEACYTNLVE